MREPARTAFHDLVAWSTALSFERVVLAGLLAAVAVQGLGSAWDAHWHVAVGRDSLWIPPHVMIILGTALSGVLAGMGGLRPAMQVRSLYLPVILQAPETRGYGVVVTGACTLAGAIAVDELWHRTIGDFTIWSPPHVLAVVGGILTIVGATITFIHATQRQVLPAPVTRAIAVFFLAAILVAVYFGLLPAATMAILPRGREFTFFTFTTPYFLAVLAALMLPALVTGSQAILGRGGFRTVAVVAGLLWSIQEAFHLLATPLVAAAYGYVVRSSPTSNLGFEVLVLGFALLPALALEPVVLSRPRIGGAALGAAYIIGVAVWLAVAGRMQAITPLGLSGVIVLSALSAAAGARGGRWIRHAADLD